MLLCSKLGESASASRFTSESMVLLDVTYIRLDRSLKCSSSEMQGFKAS